jgi:hypothetical protein
MRPHWLLHAWKLRSDSSYKLAKTFDTFAQRAHVVTEYPADTLLIDDHLGIEIQFDSLDNELDEVTFDEAQGNHLLLFVGDEILSCWDVQLIAAGRYRLWTIRARYDTSRKIHPVNAEVWVVPREDLAMHQLEFLSFGAIYKLQPFLKQSVYDLAPISQPSLYYVSRASRPLAPRNLSVAGDGYNPTYDTGTDIVADWDKTANRALTEVVTEVLTPSISKTVLEVLTTDNVLKGTFEFSGGNGPRTITNTQLVAVLGGETDFKLRAWFVRSGLRSLNYDEVTVRKV